MYRENNVVIGGTDGLLSSAGRAPDLQAGVAGLSPASGTLFPP